ncbi:MAG: response regulator [Deltaproteobacteria bacterium]|nr:MAG: response regulator [Deltaproteobacteria bacterium]
MKEKIKILVVDDEEVVCRSVNRILSKEGYRVDEALRPEVALEKMKGAGYDLVFTDWKMPGIDGMELIARIKEIRPETDIVMITGYSSIESAVKAMSLGAFNYIPKPFTPNELSNITARAIERRRLLREERSKAEKTYVIFEYVMPDDLYYLPEHAWVRVGEGKEVAEIGIDDVYQKTIGRITKIDLPEPGGLVTQGNPYAEIHASGERIYQSFSPISGMVAEVNQELKRDAGLVNKDPYGKGWIARVNPSSLEEDLKNLLHGDAVIKWWLKREIIERRQENYVNVVALDPKFKFEIAAEPGGEKIRSCFACGTCTAICPVREIDDEYNPRKIIRMALLGMREEVLASNFIWLCASCYSCEEYCPQGVKFTEVINAIKNIAVREGHIPPSFITQLELIRTHGRLYPIDDFDNKKRKKEGLPPIRMEAGGAERTYELSGLKKMMTKTVRPSP